MLFDESTFSDEEAEFDWKAYLLEEEDLYTVHYADTPVNMYSLTLNPYSAGIDFSRQNLTSADVRFRRLKSIPAL